MSISKKSFISVPLFLLILLPLSLCAQKLEKVTLQLHWLDQFQFAGYYIAKDKGFYEEVGLDVDIKKFQIGIDPLEDILNDKATYGIGRSSLFVQKGKGREIQLLAAIFQSSPSVLLARKDSGIKSIDDFPKKRVMMTGAVATEVSIQAMMKKTGNDLASMQVLNHTSDLNDLIEGRTDLMSSYLSNEPYQLKQRGIEYVVFDPKEYGFDFYTDILFTCTHELTHHEARAKNFTKASIRGWKYAFDHIEETARLIYEKYNIQNKSLDAYIYEGEVLKELAYYKNSELGVLERDKLERIYDIYNVMGFIENEIDIDSFYLKSENNKEPSFTLAEREYIKSKKEITACCFSNFMPLHRVDGDEKMGIVSDYLETIGNKTGLKVNMIAKNSVAELESLFKGGKCDFLPLARRSQEREEVASFTQAYMQAPLVIATKKEKAFISDLDELRGEKIGILQDSVAASDLKQRYKEIQFIEFSTNEEGIKAVDKDRVTGFLGDLLSSSYLIQEQYSPRLKISGRFGEDLQASMAVKKDAELLRNVLDKVLVSIDEEEKQKIQNRWVSVRYEKAFDYDLMIKIVVVFLVLIALLLYRYRMIEKHNSELRRLSIIDPLTELYNRRFLDDSLGGVLELANRYRTPFSVILMDIDDFKMINDILGHTEGDNVLVSISNILTQYSRENDIIGRWGGEEFLIICPHTKIDGAKHLAEHLCTTIEKELDSDQMNVTASFGVAEYRGEKGAYKLIARADEALYRAKNSGKNRVVTA